MKFWGFFFFIFLFLTLSLENYINWIFFRGNCIACLIFVFFNVFIYFSKCREVYHTKRMQHVICVKWSADSKYVLSGSDEMNIRLWKANASEKLGVVSVTWSCFSDPRIIFPFKAVPVPRVCFSDRWICLLPVWSFELAASFYTSVALGQTLPNKSRWLCQELQVPNVLFSADLVDLLISTLNLLAGNVLKNNCVFSSHASCILFNDWVT